VTGATTARDIGDEAKKNTRYLEEGEPRYIVVDRREGELQSTSSTTYLVLWSTRKRNDIVRELKRGYLQLMMAGCANAHMLNQASVAISETCTNCHEPRCNVALD
jgi:hypothetical protein